MALVRIDNQANKARDFGNLNQAFETLKGTVVGSFNPLTTKDELRSAIKTGDVAIVRLGGCRFIDLVP